jgi:hypothetical protein
LAIIFVLPNEVPRLMDIDRERGDTREKESGKNTCRMRKE